jgi:leucyl aminopeptidase
MSPCPYLIDGDAGAAVPLTPLGKAELSRFLALHPEAARWSSVMGFAAEPGSHCLLPSADGSLDQVLFGLGDEPLWEWASLPEALPPGTYRLDARQSASEATATALGWALETYRFQRYRTSETDFARLIWPTAADRPAVERTVDATVLVRDLINTPASDMGPAELADAIHAVGGRFSARCTTIVGDDLLTENYPAVHAVGRASTRAPRLVDLMWGDESAPKLTLVGKGVCFDSGGLDIKPANAMKLMKKDMGGAAVVLGLAQMVMAADLPLRLRLLVPAVENSISGNALRPMDVVRTRQGRSIEIGNTDAEGRVILADALAEAVAEEPALLIDCATLTGAARVALGTEIPALFSNDDGLAESIVARGHDRSDPVWRLPLWQGYRRHLRGKTAELTNAPDLPFAGAILAALFLAEFVGQRCPWAHLDMMAWNTEKRPGRPEGGEAMGMRALYAVIEDRFQS